MLTKKNKIKSKKESYNSVASLRVILPAFIWAWVIQPLYFLFIHETIYPWHPYTDTVVSSIICLPFTISALIDSYLPSKITSLEVFFYIFLIFLPLLIAIFICTVWDRYILLFLRKQKFYVLVTLCISIIVILTIIISLTLKADANYKKNTYQKIVNELNSVHFKDSVVAYWIDDTGCNFFGAGCIVTGYKTFIHTGKWQQQINGIMTILKNSGWQVDYYQENEPYGPYDTNLQAYVENGTLSLPYDINGITGSAYGLHGDTATTNGAFELDASNNGSPDTPTDDILLNNLDTVGQNKFTYTISEQVNY